MLEIKELKKTYPGGVHALKGIDLDVSAGVFGLLGPNGAGKTTLMKILATLLEPDSGEVAVSGIVFIGQKMAARRFEVEYPGGDCVYADSYDRGFSRQCLDPGVFHAIKLSTDLALF